MKPSRSESISARFRWTREEVFHRGDDYFARLLVEIGKARRSLRFESYIWERDRMGERLAKALEAAAGRGVNIRVSVDGIGSSEWSRHYLERLDRARIRARVYHPLPWDRASHRVSSGLALIPGIGAAFAKLNRRNHRKTCIIDSRIAFVGSANVSETHLREFRGARAWRDTIALIEGPAVIWLVAAFEAAWSEPFKSGRWKRLLRRLARNPYRALRSYVELNDTLARRVRNAHAFRQRVTHSRKRVWLANPYFVPSSLLLRALSHAARSGIDVRVLTPSLSDVVFMPWAARHFYGPLLKSGVRIFEYLPSMFHAKVALVDNWARVGSMNLNHRSLIHDLEANVGLMLPESIESIEAQFAEDLDASREITYEDWIRRPLWERALGRLVLVLRHWI